jgi:hypothetical protein
MAIVIGFAAFDQLFQSAPITVWVRDKPRDLVAKVRWRVLSSAQGDLWPGALRFGCVRRLPSPYRLFKVPRPCPPAAIAIPMGVNEYCKAVGISPATPDQLFQAVSIPDSVDNKRHDLVVKLNRRARL